MRNMNLKLRGSFEVRFMTSMIHCEDSEAAVHTLSREYLLTIGTP